MTESNNVPSMTIAEFLVDQPLYSGFPYEMISTEGRDLDSFDGPLDCYCVQCGRQSIFQKIAFHRYFSIKEEGWGCLVQFACHRNRMHRVVFVYEVWAYIAEKVGQYPSLADLTTYDIKDYSKVLRDHASEFKKAIGLVSHGIGIGSMVYLRRIFERLVEDAHIKAKESQFFNEEEYQKARIEEKIHMLKEHLPEFLVSNRGLYGIMSKGLHELSESECLDMFPIVRHGIEMILDQSLEEKERKTKLAAAEKAISRLREKLAT